MNSKFAYLDTSAAAKLVFQAEEGADALAAWLSSWPNRLSSELLAIELVRAVRRVEPSGIALIDKALSEVALRPVAEEVVVLAGLVEPPSLKTLDAIHLATAVMVREAVGCFVTYDLRLADAARSAGLPVATPV